VLIAGEPGIGKTRLATEAALAAHMHEHKGELVRLAPELARRRTRVRSPPAAWQDMGGTISWRAFRLMLLAWDGRGARSR
jgi:hypothetical protein